MAMPPVPILISSINETIRSHGSNNQEMLAGLAAAVAKDQTDPFLTLALWLHLSRGHAHAMVGGVEQLCTLLREAVD